MKHLTKTIALSLLAAAAGTAFAQDPGVAASQEAGRLDGPAFTSTQTRAQVDARLAAAARNGTLSLGGETALREKDLNPGAYPADPVVAGQSRAQVQSETVAAIRNGDISTGGELGMPENTVDPAYYAQNRAADAPQLAQSQVRLSMTTSAH
jgi:hypothetical protein